MLAAAAHTPMIHVGTKSVLIILAVIAIGVVARYFEAADRRRRREARKQRQREYRRYLRSEGWKQRRGAAVLRSGGLCEDCGAKRDLDVHHRTYARKGAERPEDLLALCRRCHKARHKGDRTTVDWVLLAILRWWRVRRYRRSTEAA